MIHEINKNKGQSNVLKVKNHENSGKCMENCNYFAYF